MGQFDEQPLTAPQFKQSCHARNDIGPDVIKRGFPLVELDSRLPLNPFLVLELLEVDSSPFYPLCPVVDAATKRATALQNRQEFQGVGSELARTDFESWAKESFEIATKIAYRNGGLSGSARGGNKNCTTVTAAPVLPVGYVVSARRIADRRRSSRDTAWLIF